MGGGSGGGTSTSSTTASIAPELRPLFSSTAGIVQGVQPQANLGGFLGANPQVIPQATSGQLDILGRQQQRAFGEMLTPQELQAQQFAQTFGLPRGPESQALGLANNFGQLRGAESQALGQAESFGQFQIPELLALGQIGQFAGGPLGSSPATQAAMAAVRGPVLNDLALAGLGNSGAVGTELGGAFAPILAQEMATRAQIIPQLANLGQNLRQGAISGAGLQAQIGAGQRAGDVAGASLQAQIGERLRAGDIAGANLLAEQGQTQVTRESTLLSELGASEEAVRQLRQAQEEAKTKDFLRRQGLSETLTTGILGGFPASLGQTTQTRTSGGGK